MKKFTTLVMGSAAAVSMLASGAQAADPPLDEPAVAVCDAFGTGFWAIPGTSNCIKISGYIRADYTFTTKRKDRVSISGLSPAAANTNLGANIAAAETTRAGPGAAAGGRVDRIFVRRGSDGGSVQVGSITHGANPSTDASVLALREANLDGRRGDLGWGSRFRFNVDVQSMTEWGVLRAFGRLQGDNGGGVSVDKAYVQFAGLTAGWATSPFAFDSIGTMHSDAFDDAWTTHLLSYTFAAGNGISATLSLEDPSVSWHNARGTTRLVWDQGPGNIQDDNVPDVVAAFKIEQGWGKAHLAGMYHRGEIRTGAAAAWRSYSGYGVTAGVAVKAPMLEGAELAISGAYAHGLGRAIGMQNVIGGGLADAATIDSNGAITKTKGYSGSIGLTIPVSDQIKFQVAGGYLSAKNSFNFSGPNYGKVKAYTVGASVGWSPVSDLTISLGVDHDQAKYTVGNDGTNLVTGNSPAVTAVRSTGWQRKESQTSVRLRIQRDF